METIKDINNKMNIQANSQVTSRMKTVMDIMLFNLKNKKTKINRFKILNLFKIMIERKARILLRL